MARTNVARKTGMEQEKKERLVGSALHTYVDVCSVNFRTCPPLEYSRYVQVLT